MIQELPKLLAYIPAEQATFNEQSSQLAAIEDKTKVVLFALPSMKQIAILKHDLAVKHCYFSDQGDFLVTVSGEERDARQARLWSTETGEPLSDSIDVTEPEFQMKEVPIVRIALDGQRFTVVWAGMYNRWHSKVVAKVFDRLTSKVISPTFAHHSDLDMINGYQSLSQDGLRMLVPRGLLASDKRATWENPNFPEEANVTQQYDLMTGKLVHNPLSDKQDFYDFPVYDHSATKIATQVEGEIHVWNAIDGSLLHKLAVPPPTKRMSLSFSPNGDELLAVDRGRAILWELGKDSPVETWEHDGKFTIDSRFTQVIYKSTHGNFYYSKINRVEDSQEVTRHLSSYGQAWFCDDGSKYVLESERLGEGADNEPRQSQVFDSATGLPLSPPWHMTSSVFHDTLLSKDGRFVVSLDKGLLVWDLSDRQSCLTDYPKEPSLRVMAADYNESRSTLAVLDSQQQLTVLDTNSQHLLYPPLSLENEWNRDEIKLSPDAAFLIQIQESKRLTLWDLKNGRAVWKDRRIRDTDYWVSEVQFLDNGKDLCILETESYATNSSGPDSRSAYRENLYVEPIMRPTFDKPVRTYLSGTGVSLGYYKGRSVIIERLGESPRSELDSPQEASIESTAQSPNRMKLRVLDPITLTEVIPSIEFTGSSTQDLIFTPDGEKLVFRSGLVWDVKSATRLHEDLTDQKIDQVVIRSSGDEFLLVMEGGGSMWSAPGRIARFSIQGKSLGSQMISPSSGELVVCYHPSEEVVGSSAHGLRLWDLHTSAPLTRNFELQGHRRGSLPIFFSPNGSRLYSIGDRLAVFNYERLTKHVETDQVLDAWAKLLSGKRVDTLGALVELTKQDYEHSWNIIQAARLRESQ